MKRRRRITRKRVKGDALFAGQSGLVGDVLVISGLSQKAIGKGRKFGKNEFVQKLLGRMFPDLSTAEVHCHAEEFVADINDRLSRDPEYRERYPKGAKVSDKTIQRAWDAVREANTRHLNKKPEEKITK
jgi:hypothetical protein